VAFSAEEKAFFICLRKNPLQRLDDSTAFDRLRPELVEGNSSKPFNKDTRSYLKNR
jgi:hypothetical protein